MYYQDLNVYEKNNVLFDLKNMQTFTLDDPSLEIFHKLSNHIDTPQMAEQESYHEIKTTFFQNDRTEKGVPEDSDAVVNIQLKISNTCNLRCTYCYANQGNYNKEDSIMSEAIARRIAQKINQFFPTVQKISFFGGEPLLNLRGIETILNTLKNKSIQYSMVTNGTVWNTRLADLVKAYDIKLIISVDGPEQVHDMYRTYHSGKGSYNTIASNIDAIQSNSNAVAMLAAVYTKYGAEKYSKMELYDFLYNRFKVKAIGISDVFTDLRELIIPEDSFPPLSPREAVEFTLRKIMNNEFFVINAVHDILGSFFNGVHMNQFCGAGVVSLFIDEEGNVCPCQLFTDDTEYDMGNILQENSLPYDQSDQFLRVRGNLKKVRKSSITECQHCIARFWCFRCIGKYKSEKNFGACNDLNECSYSQQITIETLNLLSEYINEGKFEELMRKMNMLSRAMRVAESPVLHI